MTEADGVNESRTIMVAGRGSARRWLSEAVADVRYALRTWRRQPALVAVAVLSLAAGTGLNTTVFGIINTIFFQSLRGVAQPDRVVTMAARVPFTTFRDVRDHSRTLSGVAAWQPIGVDIRVRGTVLRTVVPVVSENYFAVLGVTPARGRLFDPATPRHPAPEPVAVLDYEFWTDSLDSDPAVLGATILVNRVPTTVIGIAPRSFHGFGPVRPVLWMPMGMKPAVLAHPPRWEDPAESGWRPFGRLASTAALAHVDTELRRFAADAPAQFPGGALRATSAGESWSGPVSPEKQIEFLLVVVLPLVVAGLILWIGCSNVANLLLARATMRQKEMAIRMANGASRPRLIRQLLTEGLLLALAGGAAGALLTFWVLDLVWATLPEFARLAVELDVTVLIYSAAVCLATAFVFGLAPALHATRPDISPLLKGDEPGDGRRFRSGGVRTFFLVTQFASSVALLVLAGTFVRTVISTHVGAQAAAIDHLAVGYLELPEWPAAERAEHWRAVRDEILRVPQVASVSLTQPGGGIRLRLEPEGTFRQPGDDTVGVDRIDRGYFRTMGVTFVTGDADAADAGGVVERAVINEAAARRFWTTTDVVGRRFTLGDHAAVLETAGVVRDNSRDPRVYRRLADGDLASANVMIRTTQPAEAMAGTLRTLLERLSPDRAFTRVSTFREAGFASLDRLTRFAVIIAAVVLSLATVGLYGSVSFVTSLRTREIAIRLAIGAPRRSLLRLLARDGVRVVAAGTAAGLLLTGVAFRFMSGMLFADWTLDPLTVLGVVLTLAVATAAACFVPARRALRIEPMEVLKGD